MAFSLLRPRGATGVAPRTISAEAAHDLGLEAIARQLAKQNSSDSISLRLLTELPQSAEEIRYRQATVRLLWQDPELCTKLEHAHESLKELTLFGRTGQEAERPLMAAIWRLGELELYVDLVKLLCDTLRNVPSEATALHELANELEERSQEPAFVELEKALPRLRRGLKLHQSVTIGINLDDRLRPVEAALLSVNSERYRSGQFLSSFFGKATGNPFVTRTPIHQDSAIDPFSGEAKTRLPLSPLFDELDGVLRSMVKPLARELRTFLGVSTNLLRSLVPELGFFISAVRYLRELEVAGFPLCFPTVSEPEERSSRFEGLYNLRLAHHWIDEPGRMVANDIELGPRARLYVLTGPNGGGKTTFTQAVGLASVLGQAGLPVPATAADISPVDGVFTHFPAEESLEDEIGRFEDEARRVSQIFEQVSDRSLVLLNEPLASTSPDEAERIAGNLMRGFRFAGARGIVTTHFHALALDAPETNRSTQGTSAIGTLNAQTNKTGNGVERTYRIVEGAPSGTSYAADIAKRYGIDEESLMSRLRSSTNSGDRGTA